MIQADAILKPTLRAITTCGGAACGHGDGAHRALTHEFEDVGLGGAASIWVLHLPVASSSMARRVFSGIRRVLSMGSAGGPALTAASALRGLGF
jgi:hypothetical protein